MEEEMRTPGPWSVNSDTHYEGGKPGLIWGPLGPGHGAVCSMTPQFYPRDFNAADARLIAAAPDMHEALEAAPVIRLGESFEEFGERYKRWHREVRVPAVAKAEGK